MEHSRSVRRPPRGVLRLGCGASKFNPVRPPIPVKPDVAAAAAIAADTEISDAALDLRRMLKRVQIATSSATWNGTFPGFAGQRRQLKAPRLERFE